MITIYNNQPILLGYRLIVKKCIRLLLLDLLGNHNGTCHNPTVNPKPPSPTVIESLSRYRVMKSLAAPAGKVMFRVLNHIGVHLTRSMYEHTYDTKVFNFL